MGDGGRVGPVPMRTIAWPRTGSSAPRPPARSQGRLGSRRFARGARSDSPTGLRLLLPANRKSRLERRQRELVCVVIDCCHGVIAIGDDRADAFDDFSCSTMRMTGIRIGRRFAGRHWAVRVGSSGCAGVWRHAALIGVGAVAVLFALVAASTGAGLSGLVHPRLAAASRSTASAPGTIGPVWSIQRTPNPAAARSFLKGVSCTSARACVAVGVARGFPLVERWNGSKWSIQRSARGSGHVRGVLYGVSCASERSCVAVGMLGGLAFAERWNGSTWSVQDLPNPPGARTSVLYGVSCTSPMGCTAVGSVMASDQPDFPLLERWNGSRWSIQTGVNLLADEGGELDAVSCSSRTACIAVGSLNPSDTVCPEGWVAERWNGIHWRLLPALCSSPGLAWGEMEPHYYAVACASAKTCVAGGHDQVSGAGDFPIGARWNGTGWMSAREFDNGCCPDGVIAGVSCSSKTLCVAVGTWDEGPHGFALVWNAGRWQPRRRDTGGIFPQAVSCPSAASCMVVGNWRYRAASALLRR
jgi:hypothetical protein